MAVTDEDLLAGRRSRRAAPLAQSSRLSPRLVRRVVQKPAHADHLVAALALYRLLPVVEELPQDLRRVEVRLLTVFALRAVARDELAVPETVVRRVNLVQLGGDDGHQLFRAAARGADSDLAPTVVLYDLGARRPVREDDAAAPDQSL